METDEQSEDAALIAAVVRGDHSALGALYDRHSPTLFGLARRIVGDYGWAQDLVHDVFLEAWHQAATFDPSRGSVGAWLVIRMRSRALDSLSARTRSERFVRAAADTSPATEPPDVVFPDKRRVRSMVVALPPELNAVVELAYFDGLSMPEIAEHLGVPVGTVKSRIARALELLRGGFR